MGRKMLKKVTAVLILAAAVWSVALLLARDVVGKTANRDFIAYWAAGRLLIGGENPYNPATAFKLERAAGLRLEKPLMMRNIPSALVLTLPLGLLDVKPAILLWSLAIIASVVVSVRLIWILYGRRPDRLHLIGYTFAPILMCIPTGQSSAFVLSGFVLFLHLHERRPFLAGVALALCAVKPHLFIPLGLVLVLWGGAHRAYKLALGLAATIMASVAVVLSFDPLVFAHYGSMMRGQGLDTGFVPTVSVFLRAATSPASVWIQYLPTLFACVWAAWYFRRHKHEWNWRIHGSLLILVSVWVAPYSWFTDEAAVLPAIMHGVYTRAERGQSLLAFGILNGLAVIEVALDVTMPSGGYAWTATAWLLWYLWGLPRRFCWNQVSETRYEIDR